MKKELFFIVGLLLCSSVALFAQPKIEVVGGTTIDFGDAYSGSKADRLVQVKNVGNDTLKISEVKAQCGCTAAMMSNKELGPGQTGKLSISFNTQNYGGKVTKQVYITSNDTGSPRTTINFNVNIVTVLDLNPKFLSFDNSKLDTTYTKVVTITNASKDAVTILSVNNPDEQVKVSMMKTKLMPGEATQLQAVFKPSKSGTYNGNVELVTDHKAMPKYEVKWYAWVNRQ
jgi:hypothetical protein